MACLHRTFLPATLITLTIIAMLLAPAVTSAQTNAEVPDGVGFFAIGGSRLATGDLEERLEGAGYPPLGGGALTIGGGGYHLHRERILVGGEGYGVLAGREVHEGRSISLAGGYGLFNVGYVMTSGRTRAYPMIGFGGGGAMLRIGSAPTSDNFDDVLNNPNRHAALSRGSLLMSLGVGADYRLNPDRHGLVIGVRFGYLFAPFNGPWRLDTDEIGGGPDASLAGPYVRVTIGGGR